MLSTVRFVLVHSPVVGPTTWQWVADALRGAGENVTVPNLVAAAATASPHGFVFEAISAAGGDDDVVIVGHSGAGVLLPLIAEGLSPRSQLIVFVDAGVPPCEGTVTIGGNFLPTLRELAVDGLLPRWTRWWDDGVLEVLVPLEDRRRQVESELPTVPLSFYEASIAMPPGWCTGRTPICSSAPRIKKMPRERQRLAGRSSRDLARTSTSSTTRSQSPRFFATLPTAPERRLRDVRNCGARRES